MKTALIAIVLIVIVGAGIYFVPKYFSGPAGQEQPTPPVTEQATTTERAAVEAIGKSVEERDITAYHYGTGETELLFVGGIHGGYSWNTVLVAYELMDYLAANPGAIPENITVTVIPVLNPDGLNKIVGTAGRFEASDVPQGSTVSGRFNANNVDLNRNFDCEWQASGTWQNTKVSGGSKAFSEPESAAIKAFIEAHKPSAAIVWYSAAGGVFASNCNEGVLPETLALTNAYAKASGYKAYETFDFYSITGDMVNWFAKLEIPAISVLLTNHTDIEWEKNLKGIEALLKEYAE
ncbi:hypothetical protein A2943_02465 [Candidatus Adlerbacteria bacterium RIFCSPLOWO2_01_FULL_51_16]|uniref:Peptidase M14 domain-containing protein n=1 Tax=Candidatus Adlerbacteria bacterium RIFCSPLOWO2_01_FULL_51_16 TaxID=1797243 RepID=A0A1F4XGD1_9BACT|nr:MAG: hypothetical protein A2943_02465 [Candidatus Adlerbacteria bacterium RIFCSPLOWO2_01_FULL_51_16]